MRALGLVALLFALATLIPATIITPGEPTVGPTPPSAADGTLSPDDRVPGPTAVRAPSTVSLSTLTDEAGEPEVTVGQPPSAHRRFTIHDPDPTPEPANRSEGAIVAVYPDPVALNDRGEYVVVEYPPGAGWTLTDGETRVRLPGAAGRAVVTSDPGAVDVSGAVVENTLGLANGGETLRLRHGGTVVDEVTYEDAQEGEILEPETGEWRPLGSTEFAPMETGQTTAEAFVLPDAPVVVSRTLQSADHRILLGGYTFSSWRLGRALVAARERGVTVRVLVDGSPVGGTTRRQARVLDWLVDNGVHVAVLTGARARYDFHHAKYAVVDDRAMVLTENYKPAGTGGQSSRGWGVVLDDSAAAAHLAAVFRADSGWRDSRPWVEFRANRSFEGGGVANQSYPARFRPREVTVERARVLVAPDNAEGEIVDAVRGAERSILVQQVSVGGADQPFLRATVDAAHRGVQVRVLLSSAWYVEEDNRRLVEQLNDVADRDGLPLVARLAEPRSRYEKIHAKGAVVDEETVVLGSVNWNNHSVRENREVAVVLEGEDVGGYYARAFRADWRGGTRQLPAGVVAVVALAACGGVGAVRTVAFEREA